MRNIYIIILLSIISCQSAWAGPQDEPANDHPQNGIFQRSIRKQYEFSIGISRHVENLNWNEASAAVNIASEVKWENLQSTMLQARTRIQITENWEMQGNISYGNIDSGSNQDSDYNGNNRTLEYSRSNNKGGGNLQNASLGAGRNFQFANATFLDWLIVTPGIGYAIYQQNLTMTDGVQTIPASGPYIGLNNQYQAIWSGPWLGISNYLRISERLSLNASIIYSQINFQAEANWNLRTDFAHPLSFKHRASGDGLIIQIGSTYQLNKEWKIILSLENIRMTAKQGTDTTYYSDGTWGLLPLNEANWESSSLNSELAYSF